MRRLMVLTILGSTLGSTLRAEEPVAPVSSTNLPTLVPDFTSPAYLPYVPPL